MQFPSGIKRALRPAVARLRHALRRLHGGLRPPVPWNGRHHPALERIPPWSGQADGRFLYDSFGIRTDPVFRPQFLPQPPGPLQTEHPSPDNAYLELVFVLESLHESAAAGRFRILELGAGYGPWLTIAHRAAERTDGASVELVGVEMVPQHFEWMHEHLRNNGIDTAAHLLLHGAVSDRDGDAWFRPDADPAAAFGQRMTSRRDDRDEVRVPCIDVRRLLEEQDPFDLIHVDIQGEELRVLEHAWPLLQRKTRRLLVATHTRRIHRRLRSRFHSSGWSLVYDYRMRKRQRTAFGDIHFLDGLLAAERRGRA